MKTLIVDKSDILNYFFDIKKFCDNITDDENYDSKYWMYNNHSLLNKS